MRALIVEDDRTISEFVARGLREAGFAVDEAADGEAGLEMALAQPFDVAILDLMLPRRDGLTVIDELRRRGRTTPVLILSARRSVDDRVRGLQSGGDDYLTKPFAFDELLARVRAMTRRRTTVAGGVLRYDDLELDRLRREVRRGAIRLDLAPREFRLLEHFLLSPEQVITRTNLLEKVWDMSFHPETNVVEAHISNLRRKLEARGAARLIQTVRGAGYMLRRPEGPA